MTPYTQHDPRLFCIDCDFLTYSENGALIHADTTGHVVEWDPVTW